MSNIRACAHCVMRILRTSSLLSQASKSKIYNHRLKLHIHERIEFAFAIGSTRWHLSALLWLLLSLVCFTLLRKPKPANKIWQVHTPVQIKTILHGFAHSSHALCKALFPMLPQHRTAQMIRLHGLRSARHPPCLEKPRSSLTCLEITHGIICIPLLSNSPKIPGIDSHLVQSMYCK